MLLDHLPAEPNDCDDCSEGPKLPDNIRLDTGEFVWQDEDLRIPGRGLDFAWTRTYRSVPDPGALHWDHAYNLRAERTPDGIRVWTGIGTAHLFPPGPTGTFSARGVFAEGRLDAANQFRLRFAGGGEWEFRPLDTGPAAGHIARIVDRNGNALRFGYDRAGRLEAVTDTLGREIRVGYDRAGRLATVTDFTGRRLSYGYNADGDLTSVTYPAVTGTLTRNDFPDGATVRYTYSARGRLSGITDRAGKTLLNIGYASAFDHDRVGSLHWADAGNPVHVAYHPIDETSAALLAIVNDANGNVREFRFDALGACVSVREYTAQADPAKPTTDTGNRPSRAVREGEPPFVETRYAYDNPDGLLTRILRADGSVTEKTFEIDLRPDAGPIERGNLRVIRTTPGMAGADQPELVRRFEYLPRFGCSCGQAFVTKEIDQRGGVRSTTYDDRGNPTVIVERDGSRTQLTYGTSGELVTQTLLGEGVPRRDVFTYSDRNGQRVSETQDADGLALTTTYQHDDLGRLVLLRDPDGHEQRHVWNAWDLLVRRILPDSTDAAPSTEDTLYDANRKPVRVVVRDGGRETIQDRTYDARGRVLTISRPAAQGRSVVTAYEYDGNGNRVATRQGESQIIRLFFDALDRPYRRTRGDVEAGYREVTYDFDAMGNPVRVTRGADAEGSTTQTRYDGYGRPVTVELPNGTIAAFEHDLNGNLVGQTIRGPQDATPVVEVSQEFDAMDRLVRRTTTGVGIEPAIETWEFDERSRLVRRTDIAGQVWSAGYDALDRPVEIDDGSSRSTTYAYDNNSNLLEEVVTHRGTGLKLRTAYVRDSRGRMLGVNGPRGMVQTYSYAGQDLPATIALPGGRRVDMDYDDLGRLTRVRWSDQKGGDPIEILQSWDDSSHPVERTDPNGNTTRYVHDAAGNLVEITHPDGTKQSYSYDTRGNCVGWSDANGTKVVNAYDPNDRLVRRDVTPGPEVAADTTTESYQYDALGNLVRAANARHTVERTYDALSRVLRQVQDGLLTESVYDDHGRRTSVSHPSGYRLGFEYEGTELRALRDARGAAITFDAEQTTRFARTPVSSTIELNAAGLAERLLTSSPEIALDERRYQWDELGNVAAVQMRGPSGTRDVSYELDAAGRLRAARAAEGRDVSYALDPAGNRSVVRTGGQKRHYAMSDSLDRATNRYTQTPGERRTYDANGNLLTAIDEQGRRRSMRYDYLNRMVEYRDESTGLEARYSYDCFGRRLAKSVSKQDKTTTETTYVFDGDDIVEERDAAGGTARSLLRHGRSVYGMVTGEDRAETWFITDVLGSVVAEFDGSGAVTRTYEYGDYGEVLVGEGVTASPVLFAGYLYDRESSLYYVRTRYLEPATGRFTTRDSAGVWEDGRNRGNAYAYAGNNPVTFIDPTGRSTIVFHSCTGPAPGPRTIRVEYTGCSAARRSDLTVPVCRAFRAAGRGADAVLQLWTSDSTGVPKPGDSTTRGRVVKWFGGPDGMTSTMSKAEIGSTLRDSLDGIKSNEFAIDCEGGNASCTSGSTVNAYVWTIGGWAVNLTNRFFNCFNRSQQAAIILHEATHLYNDTDDYFYYKSDGDPKPFNDTFETPILRENADTYEQFALNFFIP